MGGGLLVSPYLNKRAERFPTFIIIIIIALYFLDAFCTEGGGTDSVSSLCQQFKCTKTGYHLLYISENSVVALPAKFDTPPSPKCCVMFRGKVQRYCLLLLQQLEGSSADELLQSGVTPSRSQTATPAYKTAPLFEDYERPRCTSITQFVPRREECASITKTNR